MSGRSSFCRIDDVLMRAAQTTVEIAWRLLKKESHAGIPRAALLSSPRRERASFAHVWCSKFPCVQKSTNPSVHAQGLTLQDGQRRTWVSTHTAHCVSNGASCALTERDRICLRCRMGVRRSRGGGGIACSLRPCPASVAARRTAGRRCWRWASAAAAARAARSRTGTSRRRGSGSGKSRGQPRRPR